MIRYLGVVGLGLSLLAGGCTRTGDLLGLPAAERTEQPLNGPAIQTDSSMYHVRSTGGYQATIGLTYTNRTGARVYIAACHSPHPPLLEKWEDGEWVTAYHPPVPACLTPPVGIEPRQSYTYTYRIIAGLPYDDAYPKFRVSEIPGSYRLRWLLRGPNAPLPLDQTISNTFELRLEGIGHSNANFAAQEHH
jgi:hypothetical protein